jgi:exopolyphosphatase/guanosine-5'-triphosphate,3'-diphosphate pyrophosphatase
MTEALVEAALELARALHYEEGHAEQVARLALAIFDDLQTVHGLGEQARARLHAAAILHDVGLSEQMRGHHKVSQRLILEAEALPADGEERSIVACIARYHRKALPSMNHAEFAALSADGRRLVEALAAILRVADGLDATHRDLVASLAAEASADRITIRCRTRGDARKETEKAIAKGDLFERVFGRRLVVTVGP